MIKENHELFMEDLKGKQSVRATFRLPRQVIGLLSVMAAQLGIKQKSLFDHLVENSEILEEVAAETKEFSLPPEDRQQKTFVISRSSLVTLDRIARDQHLPRDVLVEAFIRRLLPVIDTELKKHKKRKTLLRELENSLQKDRQLLKKTEDLLGREDQLYGMIDHQVKICEKNVETLKNIIAKGKPMEEW